MIRAVAGTAALGFLVAACSSKKAEPATCGGPMLDAGTVAWPNPGCGLCAAYAKPMPVGPVPGELGELSGIAASRARGGVFYAHNDSGDPPRIFVLDAGGKELGQLCVAGAENVDWEDIATGPCSGGSCIYVGDIGDNGLTRQTYGIYRAPEPAGSAGNGAFAGSIEGELFPFLYDDGPHNAEALFVHPTTGQAYVIIKQPGVATLFEVPLTGSHVAGQERSASRAVRVGDAPVKEDELVTGADMSPCGNALLVRTSHRLYELRSPDGAPASVDALLLAKPEDVPVAMEPKGEAVSYQADGLGYVTASERGGAPAVYIEAVGCQ